MCAHLRSFETVSWYSACFSATASLRDLIIPTRMLHMTHILADLPLVQTRNPEFDILLPGSTIPNSNEKGTRTTYRTKTYTFCTTITNTILRKSYLHPSLSLLLSAVAVAAALSVVVEAAVSLTTVPVPAAPFRPANADASALLPASTLGGMTGNALPS